MAEAYVSSTRGIGQGAAQVFNFQPLVQLYARQQQMKQQRQLQEQAAFAEMTKQLESGKKGLRVEDLPDYNQRYNQFKELYLQNPKLYSNPAANIDAYRQAEKLKAEMNDIVIASSQFKDVSKQALAAWSRNPYRLSDDAMTRISEMSRKPVMSLVQETGGIPNITDMLKFRPEDVDVASNIKAIQQMTDAGNGYEMIGKRSTWKDDTSLGEGNERIWQDKIYKPESLAASTSFVLGTNSKLERYYQNKFADTDEATMGSLQQKLDDKLGKNSFRITDPEKYAQAEIILNYGEVSGRDKAKVKISEEWKQQRETERMQAQEAKERRMAIFRNSLPPRKGGGDDDEEVPEKLNDNKLALFYRAGMGRMPETAEGLPTVSIRAEGDVKKQYIDLSSFLGNIKIGGQFGDKSEKFIRRVLKDPAGDGLVVVLNGKDDLVPVLGRSAKKEADPAWGGYAMRLTPDEVTRLMRTVRTQNNLKDEEVQALEKNFGPQKPVSFTDSIRQSVRSLFGPKQ